jgi:hypothetical protein
MSRRLEGKLLLREIEDQYTLKNFEFLQKLLDDFALFKGRFSFFTITFTTALTNFKFKHGLGFIPKDILQTSLTGSGTITFNYTEFDRDNLDITVTGPCVVRFYAGSYEEDT